MKHIRPTRAVIPCGGLGTRFLPITKAVPKEILPIIDTPVLAYIIDEAVRSGIDQVLVILGPGKEAIRDYFSPSPALESLLESQGRLELLELVRSAHSRCQIQFGFQPQPLGSGAAVALARDFTGDQPFVLAWGDDLILGQVPAMAQLADAFVQCGQTILGVQEWPTDDIVRYGVARVEHIAGRHYRCLGIVEKPPLQSIPSRLAALGRYVLTPEIYQALERCPTGAGGELQLTDALQMLCSSSGVVAYDFVGTRFDMGDKLGFAQAITTLALQRFGDAYRDFLHKLLS